MLWSNFDDLPKRYHQLLYNVCKVAAWFSILSYYILGTYFMSERFSASSEVYLSSPSRLEFIPTDCVCSSVVSCSSVARRSAQLLDQFTYIFKFFECFFPWDPYTVVTIKSHEPLIIEWTTIIGRGLHTLLVSLSVKPGASIQDFKNNLLFQKIMAQHLNL